MASIRIETAGSAGAEAGNVMRAVAQALIGDGHQVDGEAPDVRLLLAVVPGDPLGATRLAVLVGTTPSPHSLDLAMRLVGLCDDDHAGDDHALVSRLDRDAGGSVCALRLAMPAASTAEWRAGFSAGVARAVAAHLRSRRRLPATAPLLGTRGTGGRYGFRIAQQARERTDIWHEVPLVPQTTGMSCWAAAAAMIVGWRDRIFVDQEEIAHGIGRWSAYRDGLQPDDVQTLSRVWGLVVEEPRTYAGTDLAELLTRCGPLWLGQADPDLHVICVVGLSGDGTAEGTRVRINDPWPPGRGERYSLSLGELVGNFRAASEQVGMHAQVLHAGGRGAGTRRIAHSREVSWSLDDG